MQWLYKTCYIPLRSSQPLLPPPPSLVLRILITLSLGDYEMDVSPYEDTVTRKPWKMNLSKLNMLKPGVEGSLRLGCEGWAWTMKEGWLLGNTSQRVYRGRVLACQVNNWSIVLGWESELWEWCGLMCQQRAIVNRDAFKASWFQKVVLYKVFDGVAAIPEKKNAEMKYLPSFEAARKVAFCPWRLGNCLFSNHFNGMGEVLGRGNGERECDSSWDSGWGAIWQGLKCMFFRKARLLY